MVTRTGCLIDKEECELPFQDLSRFHVTCSFKIVISCLEETSSCCLKVLGMGVIKHKKLILDVVYSFYFSCFNILCGNYWFATASIHNHVLISFSFS